ncbi:tryptophan synthase beta subunit-like PLP-dependent enzyme [Entophlyctis helioformis]|nr:tryptophan synthase beta subunit-like PLP-dependent enzyme [Entophlyctis helioformis]
MLYRSTRAGDADGSRTWTLEDAVLQGLAPDGGLFVPVSVPALDPRALLASPAWTDASFADLAKRIFRLYIDTDAVPDAALHGIVDRSFGAFSHADVTPVVRLPHATGAADASAPPLWVLELFHGPTHAFKDVALQFLGNLFDFFLRRRNAAAAVQQHGGKRHAITVVGATSGDTGGAAIYGLRGKPDIQVFILHPHKRISPDMVKALFGDEEFRSRYSLAAINSINWARILAQTTYYFYAYYARARATRVQFSVPTGNFGDVLAGFYARAMGLPVHRFVVATNENDILHRFLQTGRYTKPEDTKAGVDPVKQTLSPAMDILVSSNFERLLWYLVGVSLSPSFNAAADPLSGDNLRSLTVKSYMDQVKTAGGFSVPPSVLAAARSIFASDRVDDASVAAAIQRYYHVPFQAGQTPYVLDPHTAVGVVAAERLLKSSGDNPPVQTVCLGTASPGKFPEAVLSAINESVPEASKARGFQPVVFGDIAPRALVELDGLPQRCVLVRTGLVGVRQTIQGTLDTPKSHL